MAGVTGIVVREGQKELAELTSEVMASITGYPFILNALSVANLI
jgi:hypothetical protein